MSIQAKQKRGRRTLVYVLGGIVFLLLVGLAGGYLYLRQSLPQTRGEVAVSGLDGTIEIVRDASGVPHIFAGSDHDAWFALGYVHAQDRMWQLEFQRRVGAGRLSEILGEETLETDKFLRTLGPYRAARTAYPGLSETAKTALEAYTAGVNAWLAEEHPLPLEFLLLDLEPEAWTVHDSLAWVKMMAWDLSRNRKEELLRLRLAQVLGPERAVELMPPYPEAAPTILAAAGIPANTIDGLLALETDIETRLGLGHPAVGSNNWVVGGSRTESGLPLLANDIHLSFRIPAVTYLAELQGDSLHVVGATIPGLPAVAIGHNEDIAWGVTNLGPDVQDLYIERINPENPNQYEVDGEWVDMGIVEELIYVKGEAEPVRWAARSTRHGPLISDVMAEATAPLALRWTALNETDTTADAFFEINTAANWQEFTDAMRAYVAPSFNFVYADREGNIGYFAPGLIPIRAQGEGTFPVPGWDSSHEWTGWIPFERLPQTYNPEKDFVATANNRVINDDYPYHIAHDWTPPYRAQRIEHLIEQLSQGEETLSAEDMAAMQSDQFSEQAVELLPLLLAVEARNDRQHQALDIMRNWDGVAGRDSIATTIYQAWYQQLSRIILEDELQGELLEDFVARKHPHFLKNVVADPNSGWCDNVLTVPGESCVEAAGLALEQGLDDLEERLGDDPANWQWGKLHRTQHSHNPFSEVAALKWLFHREIENGGDDYTINMAELDRTRPFLQIMGPAYRQVIDVANPQNNVFVQPTGQSGNVLSPHYDDLVARHQAVEYLPMTFGREQVSGDILILRPR